MEDMLQDMEAIGDVNVFSDGTVALEEIKKRLSEKTALPQLILLDVRMPEMDGYEFLQELEYLFEDDHLMPIIFMLTSSEHKKDLESFSRYSCAKEYLNKPMQAEILNELLHKYFNSAK
jgi:CheY-like chemotaxis protein